MLSAEKTAPRLVLALLLLATIGFAVVATRQYLASRFAGRPDLPSLRAAVRLAPGNAEFHYRLGRYLSLLTGDMAGGLEQYQAAVRLNPYEAHYWLELATSYSIMGDDASQLAAIQRAIQADPTTPDVAWEAANFYVVRGQQEPAVREFAIALQNTPTLSADQLRLCWRAIPDLATVLYQVLPPRPDAYLTFLDLLLSQKQTAGAAQVWSALEGLHQPFEIRYLFGYVHYLVAERETEQAQKVWEQGMTLLGMTAYLPSADNLVVNHDFSLDVLNGGFDWIYDKQPGVSLTLDSSEFRSGNRSLRMEFENAAVNDAGIYHLVPLLPDTRYSVTLYFKTSEFSGAGGIHLALQDLYSGQTYFESDDLVKASVWKSVSGTFTAGHDARMLAVRFPRLPAGSPIRGKLWLGNLQIALHHVPNP
jgi:tetratricopeptide (TPR) repeat protein